MTTARDILHRATGQIVPLFASSDSDATCFTEVESYWHALRDGRLMPSRSEIDPRGIAGALEQTFLLERMAPGVARFRLAGNRMADLMGMDVRGMPLSCLFLPDARAAIAEALACVFDEPARVELWLAGPRRLTRGRMAARMLLLPLRDDHGQVTRALGCLAASPVRGAAPHRFTITSDLRQTLIGYGTRPDARSAQNAGPAIASKRPALTVIAGGVGG